MKLRFLILSMALFACASVVSAQDIVTEELSAIVEETDYEVDFTEEVQPLQLYALAQNVDDNELLRMYNNRPLTDSEKVLSKAKKMRLIGWIGGGVIFVTGLGIALNNASEYSEFSGGDSMIIVGTTVGAAAWALGFNLYANSLQKKAYAMTTYSAPIIEGDIMSLGGNKLMAGVSVMGNQYTHTRGLGMSLKLNF